MRIILTGGGTGGHVYPAISIMEALKEKDSSIDFLYVGTEKGLENKIAKDMKIEFEAIDIQGINKKIDIETVKRILKIMKSIFKARDIINKYKPDIVIGTGGYVSFPIIFVAGRKKIPVFIHEQNSIPGMANKFLCRYATKLFVSFPESMDKFKIKSDKIELSGNPVRKEFTNKDKKKCKSELGIEDKKVVLVTGGSGGAKVVNDISIKLAQRLKDRKDVIFLHATGNKYYGGINKDYEIPNNVKLYEYIDDMPKFMGAADIIISRAGAIALSEISTLGIPAILIPSPNVANDHQMENAKVFERNSAAIIVREDGYDLDDIEKQINILLDDEKLMLEMKENSNKTLIHNASNIIADQIFNLI